MSSVPNGLSNAWYAKKKNDMRENKERERYPPVSKSEIDIRQSKEQTGSHIHTTVVLKKSFLLLLLFAYVLFIDSVEDPVEKRLDLCHHLIFEVARHWSAHGGVQLALLLVVVSRRLRL